MRFYYLIVLLLLCTAANAAAANACTLNGEVKGRNSKNLVLHKCSESSKTLYENPVLIPIENGKFSYTFLYDAPEAYELIFEDELEAGSWRPIVFFPDAQVTFVLHPEQEANKNQVTGGIMNTEFTAFRSEERSTFDPMFEKLDDIRQRLQHEGVYETMEYEAVRQKLRVLKQDDYDARTPLYQQLAEMEKTRARYTDKSKLLVINRQDSLWRVRFSWKYAYMLRNPGLVSYYLLFNDATMEVKNNAHVAKLAMDIFPIFEKKFPQHPYTEKIRVQLAGIQTIVVGRKYIDFKAPTVAGDTVRLSTLINNKIALIDLWGSWCGPCIAKSRTVVPIYQKYKSKGFEVVGIAREFKSTDAVKRRLAKEQFSWTNLVELDDHQNVWNQYGISNGAGLMVLVDRNGVILAIDPKPEELEKILQEKL